jgi:hypothetical protein
MCPCVVPEADADRGHDRMSSRAEHIGSRRVPVHGTGASVSGTRSGRVNGENTANA